MTALARTLAPTSRLLSRLIAAPDLERIVRDLTAERFTALVHEIGVEDAGELVALATTEQIVAAFDEDLFVGRPGEREIFDRRRFVTWLEVLLEAGDAAVARRIAELSEDFVAHALSSVMLVFDHDQLRERITSDDPAADDADKALEHALNEEIDGYLLVAREEEGWDAMLSLVLALDRSHRGLLVRILDRCAALASDYIEDLEALTDALSAAGSLAEDVEAAREERRSRQGYVEPRAAKAFLALAREPLSASSNPDARDPVTRAYFRELARSPAAQPAELERARPELQPARTDELTLALERIGVPDTPAARNTTPCGSTLAFQSLAEGDAAAHAERLGELAYLSNVLLAAASNAHGERLRPAEAAEAALATVALGAELRARARRPDPGAGGARATPDELCQVLASCPADLLFREASRTLAARDPSRSAAFVRSRAELEALLDAPVPRPALKKAENTRAATPRTTTRARIGRSGCPGATPSPRQSPPHRPPARPRVGSRGR